jgi:cell wall assembly regulator SMI1
MRPELKAEIDRLREILRRHGGDFLPVEPASREVLARIEEATGIVLAPDVRDFFRFSNGSGGEVWGAVETDRLAPLVFPLLEEALCQWELYAPYDAATYETWNLVDDRRDPRIRPDYLRHRYWFPLAEHSGYCTSVQFDADPAEEGEHGQIIAYQCDPDGVFYVAGSFLEFLRRSNDLLEACGRELLYPAAGDGLGEDDGEEAEALRRVLARVARKCAGTDRGAALAGEAARHGFADTLSFLFGHDEGLRLALETAVLTGDAAAVASLLDRGIHVDTRDALGETPLMTAAAAGSTRMVRLLLARGADPEARDQEGETALCKALRKGRKGIVRLLERGGAPGAATAAEAVA